MDKETLIKILETTEIDKIVGFTIEYEHSAETNIKRLFYEE